MRRRVMAKSLASMASEWGRTSLMAKSVVVWALSENDRAIEFYKRLGGKFVREAQERFGSEMRMRAAFAFE